MSEAGTIEPDVAPSAPDSGGGLLRSSGIVAVGTTLSRITGLLRTILMAGVLGSLGVGYAYNLANTTPNMIYDLLLGGILSATLVPVLVANREQRDDRSTDAVLTVATVILFVITIAAVLLAPLIVGAYTGISALGASEPTADEQKLAVDWMRLFAPQILFYGLTTLGTALLNAHRRFAAAAFAPVLNNIWMIALLLVSRSMLEGKSVSAVTSDLGLVLILGVGTTAGIAAMALVLWPAIARAGIRWHWHFDLDDPGVRRLARMSAWTLGYVAANQITIFVVLGLAGNKVAEWNYAYQFFQLPYGVFAVSVMTAFTPELASLVEQGRSRAFNARWLQGLRLIALVILPSTVILVVFARPIVSALLDNGDFAAESVPTTTAGIAALSVGLIGFSVYLYALRGFYAHQDTKTPFLINVAQCGLTLVLAVLLADGGIGGLAWAWSLAYLVFAVVAVVALRRRTGPFGIRLAAATTAPIARMVVATAVMAVVLVIAARVLPDTGEAALVTLVVGSAIGAVVYLGLCVALGVDEIRSLPRLLLRR